MCSAGSLLLAITRGLGPTKASSPYVPLGPLRQELGVLRSLVPTSQCIGLKMPHSAFTHVFLAVANHVAPLVFTWGKEAKSYHVPRRRKMRVGVNNSAWLLESDKEAEGEEVGDSGERGTFGTTNLQFEFVSLLTNQEKESRSIQCP